MPSFQQMIKDSLAKGDRIYTDDVSFCNESKFAPDIEKLLEQEDRIWHFENSPHEPFTMSVNEVRENGFEVSSVYAYGSFGEYLSWYIKS